MVCLSSKPIVDELESNVGKTINVTRLNISSKIGRYARSKYGEGIVPTFILVDKSGVEIWQVNGKIPGPEKLLSLIT